MFNCNLFLLSLIDLKLASKRPRNLDRPSQVHQSFRVRTTSKNRCPGAKWVRLPPASRGLRDFLLTTALTTSLTLVAVAASAQSLPTDGYVVAGAATISQPNTTLLNITQQTDRAVLTWNSFSIGASNRVEILQPGSSSISIQQVIGQNPSHRIDRSRYQERIWVAP